MEIDPHTLDAFLTTPGLIILLLLITFFGYLKSNWLGTVLLGISLTTMVALSIPMTAYWQLRGIQGYAKPPELVRLAESGPKAALFAPKDKLKDPPDAIVVLGAGRNSEAPEFDFQDSVSALGLERLRYTAWLHRKTGVPVLVSGGTPGGEKVAEADLMKSVLVDDFRVDVKWVERQSRNTMENARFSQALLAEAKIKNIYLVTHAWHMRRAARDFESVGLHVTPAPTGYISPEQHARQINNYLPSGRGLYLTGLAVRERVAFLMTGTDTPPAAAEPAKTQPAPAPARK